MKRILVIGDSCRDVFVYCHAERLAPDLPVPILRVIEETSNPGMAANVVENIKALHPAVDFITNDNWESITKTRYVHRNTNHTFIRVDSDPHVPQIKMHDMPLGDYDIVVISDYNKGFLTEADIQAICERHESVFIDTKKQLGAWAEKAKLIKINNFEFERSRSTITPTLRDKIIVTRGEFGAEFVGKIYPTRAVEMKDSTGAGDSFFAGLVVRFAETEDIDESITFANECASQVVTQKGVTVISRPTHEQESKIA